MKKKIQKRSEPGLALALVALIAPVLTAGISTSFAEGIADVPQSIFDSSTFDARSFLMNRRERHPASFDVREPATNSSASSSSAASVPPCNPNASSASSSSSSSVTPLSYDDLTSTEREALRKQLRNYACPQNADLAYKALCEKLLKDMPAPETRTGLTNPNQ